MLSCVSVLAWSTPSLQATEIAQVRTVKLHVFAIREAVGVNSVITYKRRYVE